MMIVFMHTDLPEPVVPAISMCGILVRSSMRVARRVLAKEHGQLHLGELLALRHQAHADARSSFVGLGTSTPTVSR